MGAQDASDAADTGAQAAGGWAGGTPGTTDRERLVEDIEAQLRRVTVESQRLGHEFASRHGLHPTDFQALVYVMDAEGAGSPLTPGELSTRLQLTSGATTAVIDRLERHGHIRRDRDDTDRRKVHLRWAADGMAVAMDFFGRLLPLREHVMGPMTTSELAVVRSFLAAMADGFSMHRSALHEEPPPGPERARDSHAPTENAP